MSFRGDASTIVSSDFSHSQHFASFPWEAIAEESPLSGFAGGFDNVEPSTVLDRFLGEGIGDNVRNYAMPLCGFRAGVVLIDMGSGPWCEVRQHQLIIGPEIRLWIEMNYKLHESREVKLENINSMDIVFRGANSSREHQQWLRATCSPPSPLLFINLRCALQGTAKTLSVDSALLSPAALSMTRPVLPSPKPQPAPAFSLPAVDAAPHLQRSYRNHGP
jgi:hypothetical protein